MRRPAPLPLPLADSPEEVEAQFYDALVKGDIERLMMLWADDEEIVCVHPGGGRVIGPAAIRASFEAIFANGGIPVQPEQAHRLQQLGLAVHHLVERISVQAGDGRGEALVLATNVYLNTPLGWRLAAHHASPGAPHESPPAGGEAPGLLH
jgi:ketosteroid isomerase-like protein